MEIRRIKILAWVSDCHGLPAISNLSCCWKSPWNKSDIASHIRNRTYKTTTANFEVSEKSKWTINRYGNKVISIRVIENTLGDCIVGKKYV